VKLAFLLLEERPIYPCKGYLKGKTPKRSLKNILSFFLKIQERLLLINFHAVISSSTRQLSKGDKARRSNFYMELLKTFIGRV